MDIKLIDQSNPEYPAALKRQLDKDAPRSATALGSLDLLKRHKLAIFCSARCPEELILQSRDLFRTPPVPATTVVGGFHSPAERQCLEIFLRGGQPIIICPARSLVKMRIRKEHRDAFEKGRLLFLSYFRSHRHRSDVQLALRRNRFVAAMADRLLFLHAAPASKTEQFCRSILPWNKPLFTLASDWNQNLVDLGAKPVSAKEIERWNHG